MKLPGSIGPVCPWCGRDDFNGEHGLRTHIGKAHDTDADDPEHRINLAIVGSKLDKAAATVGAPELGEMWTKMDSADLGELLRFQADALADRVAEEVEAAGRPDGEACDPDLPDADGDRYIH